MGILTLLRNAFGGRSRKAAATSAEGAGPSQEATEPKLPSPATEPTPAAPAAAEPTPAASATATVPEPRAASLSTDSEHELVSAAFDNVTVPKQGGSEDEGPTPVAEEPVAAEPVAAEPVAEKPVAEKVAVEEVASEESEAAAEEPVAEGVVTGEPAAEEAVTETPAVEETVAAEAAVAEEPAPEAVEEEKPQVTEAAPEPTATAEAEPVTEPTPDPEPVAEEATAPEPEAEHVAEEAAPSEPEPAAETVVEPEPEPETEPVAEEAPAAEPETVVEPEPEPVAETTSEPEPVTETTPDPEPVAEVAPEPEPTPVPVPVAAAADGEDAPQGPPAVDDESVTGGAGGNEKAVPPTLRTAYDAAAATLSTHHLTGTTATTYLVLDRSASMRAYYKDGSAQALGEQTLALAAHLDPEAKVHVVFFSTELDGTGELTLTDHENKIDDLHAGLGRMGRTSYHAAVEEVLAHHTKNTPDTPALVVFQTDGAPDAKTPATQALTDAAKTHPTVFFSFVAFGDPENKAFDYLRKLKLTNTSHFLAGETPKELTDAEIYEGILANWRP